MEENRFNSPSVGNAYEIYTSDAAIDLYGGQARTMGLFLQEARLIDRYFTKENASVLDVGCGAGRVASELDQRGFDVLGIDISEPLIEKARDLFPDIGFEVADITATDLPSDSFDYVIFSYFGLDYVLPQARRLKALREIYRLLKPGGIFAFSSHNSWNHVPSVVRGRTSHVKDLYFTRKNLDRLFVRRKIEHIDEGDIEIYVSNPVHQWLQLRKCGFTVLDVIGQREDFLRYFARQPYYVAKK